MITTEHGGRNSLLAVITRLGRWSRAHACPIAPGLDRKENIKRFCCVNQTTAACAGGDDPASIGGTLSPACRGFAAPVGGEVYRRNRFSNLSVGIHETDTFFYPFAYLGRFRRGPNCRV